jgi:3',5'-cyclic AMP phosphodiesterase CpdA
VFRLLHLTDVHFGANCHYEGDQAIGVVEDLWRVFAAAAVKLPFDAAILSGDFPWGSNPVGFESAIRFVKYLRSTGICSHNIFVLPGNHDIQWLDPDTGKPTSLSRDEAEVRYRSFLQAVAPHQPLNETLSFVQAFAGHGVLLVGLNSARLESADLRGIGYVGYDQIYALLESAIVRHAGYIVVAAMHHHVFPNYDEDTLTILKNKAGSTSILRDAATTLDALREYNVDILLHGHLHRRTHVHGFNQLAGLGPVLPSIHVLGAGSPSVRFQFCDPAQPLHHFEILEIDLDTRRAFTTAYFTDDSSTSLRKWEPAVSVSLPLPVSPFTAGNPAARQRKSLIWANHFERIESWRDLEALVVGRPLVRDLLQRQIHTVLREAPPGSPGASLWARGLDAVDSRFASALARLRAEFNSDTLQSLMDVMQQSAELGLSFHLRDVVIRRMVDHDAT